MARKFILGGREVNYLNDGVGEFIYYFTPDKLTIVIPGRVKSEVYRNKHGFDTVDVDPISIDKERAAVVRGLKGIDSRRDFCFW